MKYSIIALFAGLVAVSAAPTSTTLESLDERQLETAYSALAPRQAGITSNELKDGPCRDVTFIMARGSTEPGNMGSIPGPPTCTGLKQNLGEDKVACQGIGTEDGYAAALAPNFQSKNTDDQSIAAGTKIVNLAVSQCPNTTILVGGYSQGSALVDNMMQELPASTTSMIKGVVLYGYTRNAQDNAQIPGYPQAQTKIFCAPGDLVCDDTLTITAAHLSYAANAPAGAKFLAGMV